MKNNRSVFIFIIVLVLLIGGAGYLYNMLTKDIQMDSFVVNGSPQENRSTQEEASDSNSSEKQSLDNNSPGNEAPSDETAVESKDESPDYEAEGTQDLEAAADFVVYDSSGNEVKLSDYLGKPVVLNFWASWCGPCKSEMPGFENMYQKYGEQVQFLMVNLTDGASETVESASSFITDNGYTFPVFFDSDSNAAYTYRVSSIPTTYLINTQGEVAAYAIGAISEAALENGIGMLLE